MDKFNKDVNPSEKRSSQNLKKRSHSKSAKIETEVLKTSLERGKIAANWCSYLDKQGSSSNLLTKKYTKQATRVFTSTKYRHVEKKTTNMPVTEDKKPKVSTGRCVAIDCEMVGVGDGKENMLARVSMVDENGTVVYDTFVKPEQRVTDYRTAVSGVRPMDMINGKNFTLVQDEVANIMKGKLLIGHALRNDLKVLYLSHPKHAIRDTSRFKLFRDEVNGCTPSLRLLAIKLLGIQIQDGEHNSVEDARAAMSLYMRYRNDWESDLRSKWHKHKYQ